MGCTCSGLASNTAERRDDELDFGSGLHSHLAALEGVPDFWVLYAEAETAVRNAPGSAA